MKSSPIFTTPVSKEFSHEDVDLALNEMLFSGGSLSLKLLGAHEPKQKSAR